MKKLLIVVDYQKDFVNGSLGFPEAEQLEQPIYEKNKTIPSGKPRCPYLHLTPTRRTTWIQKRANISPIVHCIQHTEGWKLFGKVAEENRRKTLLF